MFGLVLDLFAFIYISVLQAVYALSNLYSSLMGDSEKARQILADNDLADYRSESKIHLAFIKIGFLRNSSLLCANRVGALRDVHVTPSRTLMFACFPNSFTVELITTKLQAKSYVNMFNTQVKVDNLLAGFITFLVVVE